MSIEPNYQNIDFNKAVNHGVVDLAEVLSPVSMHFIESEETRKIKYLEQRVEELEAARWKQNDSNSITQLIAIIALAAAILAVIVR